MRFVLVPIRVCDYIRICIYICISIYICICIFICFCICIFPIALQWRCARDAWPTAPHDRPSLTAKALPRTCIASHPVSSEVSSPFSIPLQKCYLCLSIQKCPSIHKPSYSLTAKALPRKAGASHPLSPPALLALFQPLQKCNLCHSMQKAGGLLVLFHPSLQKCNLCLSIQKSPYSLTAKALPCKTGTSQTLFHHQLSSPFPKMLPLSLIPYSLIAKAMPPFDPVQVPSSFSKMYLSRL